VPKIVEVPCGTDGGSVWILVVKNAILPSFMHGKARCDMGGISHRHVDSCTLCASRMPPFSVSSVRGKSESVVQSSRGSAKAD
jgi:hypothetical protein